MPAFAHKGVKMKNLLTYTIGFCLALSLSSCATLFGPKGLHDVAANSDPQGAEIIIDGVSYGTTPTTLQLSPKESYNVTFKLGDETRNVVIQNRIGVLWIILDIAGGLVPLIVDAATGDWYELSEDQVFVVF